MDTLLLFPPEPDPEKMRSTYGMLLYMLMDSCDPEIQELLEFKVGGRE